MPTLFRNYDPGRVVATFKGVMFQAFADGTFINAERSEDGFSFKTGAGGDTTRVRNRNRNGTVTITVQAASPTNDLLSAIYALDEAAGAGVGPLLVKDLNGNTLLRATNAWIRKLPQVEFSNDASNREWVIDCHELEMSIAGATL